LSEVGGPAVGKALGQLAKLGPNFMKGVRQFGDDIMLDSPPFRTAEPGGLILGRSDSAADIVSQQLIGIEQSGFGQLKMGAMEGYMKSAASAADGFQMPQATTRMRQIGQNAGETFGTMSNSPETVRQAIEVLAR